LWSAGALACETSVLPDISNCFKCRFTNLLKDRDWLPMTAMSAITRDSGDS
jgi:hypothetical protein